MVAFACALAVTPEVLVLDEPSAGLSPRYMADIFETVKRVNATGVSVLMVEQNAIEALAHIDDLHRDGERPGASERPRGRSAADEGPAEPLSGRRTRSGRARRAGGGGLRRIMLQTAFNGLVTGIIMTMPALAVTLLFGVLKFPNFAIGAHDDRGGLHGVRVECAARLAARIAARS